MNESRLTVCGMVTSEPTLNHTRRSGLPVTNFRVTSTARSYLRDEGRWVDGAVLHLKVVCWRRLAENVAASIHRGDPVVVTGTLGARSYQTAEGQKRWSYEVTAASVGPDLNRGTTVFASGTRRPTGIEAPEPAPVPDPERRAPETADRPIEAADRPVDAGSVAVAAPPVQPSAPADPSPELADRPAA